MSKLDTIYYLHLRQKELRIKGLNYFAPNHTDSDGEGVLVLVFLAPKHQLSPLHEFLLSEGKKFPPTELIQCLVNAIGFSMLCPVTAGCQS